MKLFETHPSTGVIRVINHAKPESLEKRANSEFFPGTEIRARHTDMKFVWGPWVYSRPTYLFMLSNEEKLDGRGHV